ncbi:MAG: YebC/PmpR family DNA-binding transcriptional regulator [Patescibacteria group bacterium]
MAGHSHWKQIKEHKGSADRRRASLFAKLLRAVAVAARTDPHPQFNPRLRTTIEKARAANVPSENIERAITKATDQNDLEELTMEAYGPGGIAFLIHAITPSHNRTVNEVRGVLKDHDAKWAEPGSVRWAFEEVRGDSGSSWRAKFPHAVAKEDVGRVRAVVDALEDLDDVDAVFTNGTSLA